MKSYNIYTQFVMKIWCFVKKVSMAIVAGIPQKRIYSGNTLKWRVLNRNEETDVGSEKYYHRRRAKPAVEKQTLLKENKKQKKFE
jgi:hypothetical protein